MATKVFERKIFLKEIKELQLLKLVYHIRRNNFREYTEVMLTIKVILL